MLVKFSALLYLTNIFEFKTNCTEQMDPLLVSSLAFSSLDNAFHASQFCEIQEMCEMASECFFHAGNI